MIPFKQQPCSQTTKHLYTSPTYICKTLLLATYDAASSAAWSPRYLGPVSERLSCGVRRTPQSHQAFSASLVLRGLGFNRGRFEAALVRIQEMKELDGNVLCKNLNFQSTLKNGSKTVALLGRCFINRSYFMLFSKVLFGDIFLI